MSPSGLIWILRQFALLGKNPGDSQMSRPLAVGSLEGSYWCPLVSVGWIRPGSVRLVTH